MSDIGYVEPRIESWRRLPLDLRKRAVGVLRAAIIEHEVPLIVAAIGKDPEGWIGPYHFFWGMQVRNALREAGLTDDQLPESVSDCNRGDRNWDDYYVAVAEVAVKAGIWDHLDPEERA